ncbi:eukaryotic translation initiation factor 4B3-like [Bidens hawaiensis]|uniref:eukaryotic translation initiation factor 4B3-like n=1 Tax=Bidens hawaiensis TaxID=980011 RepID=UPI00404AA0BF
MPALVLPPNITKDDDRRPSREPLGPSRADETDDWGAGKKSIGGGFDKRGGFFEGSHSRADESDSWGSNKSFRPSEGRRPGGFDRERRMGFESSGDADNLDNWGKKKEVEGRRFGGGGNGSGSAFDSLRDRRVVNESSDSDTWGRKREELGVGGGSGGRPKLNLQPRKLPVGEVETVKPTKGSNPFGDARPREEVLKEKGEDWKEIDEKLEAMKLKELGLGDRFKRADRKPRVVEDSTEKSWRKNDVDADVASPSAEKSENGHTEEAEAEEEEEEDAKM